MKWRGLRALTLLGTFLDTFDGDIRNGYAHADYVIWDGIPSQSPGLRGTSYPGSPSNKHSQPQRGCGHSRPTLARDIRHNRIAVDDLFYDDPR